MSAKKDSKNKDELPIEPLRLPMMTSGNPFRKIRYCVTEELLERNPAGEAATDRNHYIDCSDLLSLSCGLMEVN